jgi:thymidylate synthase
MKVREPTLAEQQEETVKFQKRQTEIWNKKWSDNSSKVLPSAFAQDWKIQQYNRDIAQLETQLKKVRTAKVSTFRTIMEITWEEAQEEKEKQVNSIQNQIHQITSKIEDRKIVVEEQQRFKFEYNEGFGVQYEGVLGSAFCV